MRASIWIGFDPREAVAYAVARHSVRRHLSADIPINGVVLGKLIETGMYRRPIEMRNSMFDPPIMWDTISDAPMSTQHANARFLVPHLARHGWALFFDGDILIRGDLAEVFEGLDPGKAIYCVKHNHIPTFEVKKDNQQQTRYARKNWSSFMAINCDHPANKALTVDLINSVPGRDLHRFCWIEDDGLIGSLSPKWNWLVGHSSEGVDPTVVHFTDGGPWLLAYEDCKFSEEWRKELEMWATGI